MLDNLRKFCKVLYLLCMCCRQGAQCFEEILNGGEPWSMFRVGEIIM